MPINWKKGFDLGARGLDAARTYSEGKLNQAHAYIDKRNRNQSSILNGDSVEELLASTNPLTELDNRKLPKHVSLHLIHLFAAAGIFANAGDITRFTRDLMDSDQAALQQWLRKIFSPEEAREISLWMDTIPGAAYVGGWGHRLHHGHDLSALAELSREYGFTGALEWGNHVWLRDFWTPHGVPYLPAGSGSVYEWMVEAGISSSTALSLLTVNIADALTGLFLIRAGSYGYDSVKNFRRVNKYKKHIKEAREKADYDCEREALEIIDSTETRLETGIEAATLRLETAIWCLEQSFRADGLYSAEWGSRAYQIAYSLCSMSKSEQDTIAYQGGTRVSFYGLAATVLAAAYASHVQIQKDDWNMAGSKIAFGIEQFTEIARQQSRPNINELKLWGYRPFSAITNMVLALELSTACSAVHHTNTDPLSIREELAVMLDNIKVESEEQQALLDQVRNNIDRIYPLESVDGGRKLLMG